MKKLLKLGILLLLLIPLTATLHAQKFGHVNVGNLLVLLPETKAADEKLKVFQDSLVKIGQERAKALETEITAFSKEYQTGNVTPLIARQKEEEFKKKHEELAAFEDEVAAAIAKKREELISPILDRVQKAIDEVGKEGSYTMIFDTSVFNTILFAQESDDIEPLVKQKLGLK